MLHLPEVSGLVSVEVDWKTTQCGTVEPGLCADDVPAGGETVRVPAAPSNAPTAVAAGTIAAASETGRNRSFGEGMRITPPCVGVSASRAGAAQRVFAPISGAEAFR